MTLKIFYFLIALFSVTMIFGLIDNSYNLGFDKSDLKLADLRALKVNALEVNASNVYGSYRADEVVRYSDRDEIFGFDGVYKNQSTNRLKGDQAVISKDKNITLNKNAVYFNDEQNISYSSDQIIYANDFLRSDLPFTITQNNDKITGQKGSYDLKNKIIKADNVKGEFDKGR